MRRFCGNLLLVSPVALLRGDGPPRLVRRPAPQGGPRQLLPARFPGLRAQLLQRLLDPGQWTNQKSCKRVSAAVGTFFPPPPLSLQGCYEKVETWLDENKHLLGTIAMCVLVIQVRVGPDWAANVTGSRLRFDACSQLLGMAFSMTLYQQIHRTGKKYEA